ncbi:hypothetical protein ES703_114224 [subsurface metagenome]
MRKYWLGRDNMPLRGISTAAIFEVTAGDKVAGHADVARNTSSATYVKLKEIELTHTTGTLRIFFRARSSGAGSAGPAAAIYRNGIIVGTERVPNSVTFQEYTEDIGGWGVGDKCQIYGKTSNNPCEVDLFRISTAEGKGSFNNLVD